MKTQKIVNFLNSSENKFSKFASKKWYVIDNESNDSYSHQHPIKFLTKSIVSSLCDYSDAYILVTVDVFVKRRNTVHTADIALNAVTQVAFKNCAPFKDCRTEVNDTVLDYADFINIAMPMYNLLKYSDNYSDTSESLGVFERDEVVNNAHVTNNNNVPPFEYKASVIGDTKANGVKNGVKVAVPLKYLSNFWRSLKMPLIKLKL